MKKSKLSLGLVTSFIAAMALSACDVKAKDNALVTFTPYGGGEAVEIVTNDMYNKYHGTTDGISKFYSQILEVLIRHKFNSGNLSGALSLAEIEAKADSDVKEQKQKAKDAASTNGTTYDHEWDDILDSYNAKNAKELKQVFIYNREKEEISKWYLNNHIEDLRNEFIGVKKDGSKVDSAVDSALPYHIRHILVKAEGGASNFTSGSITSTEAKHLYNTLSKLKDGKQSFAQVAYDESDDGSGKSAYGDVGIVTNQIQSSGSLQMVSEFQLGIYAYEAILGGRTKNDTIADGLGVNGQYKDSTQTIGAAYKEATSNDVLKVPYEAVEQLRDYADLEKDKYGNSLSEGSSMVYPRNIIWNKYFNHHQVFVITNARRNVGTNQNGSTNKETVKGALSEFQNLTTNTYNNYGDRFVNVPGICKDANEKVLTDGEGHVILGVRSEFGIHLIVVQKSIYEFDDNKVSLEEYYTTEVPTATNTNYPRDDQGKDKNTYVNYIKTNTTTDYNTRATTVKDAIKGFDSTYDYRLYESLMKEFANNIAFKGEEGSKLNEAIDRYIKVTRASKHNNQIEKINDQWESYIELLELQKETRNTYYAYGVDEQKADQYKTLMVPEGCAVNFHEGGKDYEEGGKCYYGK